LINHPLKKQARRRRSVRGKVECRRPLHSRIIKAALKFINTQLAAPDFDERAGDAPHHLPQEMRCADAEKNQIAFTAKFSAFDNSNS